MSGCSLCTHPQRHQIEAALAQGAAQRAVAQQFDLSKSTLGRHVAHTGQTLPPAPAAAPVAGGPTIGAREAEHTRLTAALTALEERRNALACDRTTTGSQQAHARQFARWGELAVATEQGEQLDALLAAVATEQRTLGHQLATCHRELEAARAQYQQARQAHWSAVMAQLGEEPEAWPFDPKWLPLTRYWARIMGGERYPGMPPKPPGYLLLAHTPSEDLKTWLRTTYPFPLEHDFVSHTDKEAVYA